MNKYILLTGTAICLLSMAPIVHAQTTNNEEDTFESIQFNKGTGWIASDESGSSYTQINYLTNSDLTTLQNSINMIGNTAYATAANLRTTQEDATTAKTQASEAKTAVDNLSKTVESELALKADKTTVTDIDTRVTTNKNDIATLRTTTEENLKLKADNSTVTALDTRVKTAENDIDALEAEQDEQDTKINNITSGTTYTGTGLETAVRNTATSVFDTSLDTAIASGGRIYNFTNQQITNAVERSGAIYNFTYDTLEAEVGDRGIIKDAIDDTISTELGESGSINEAISSGADSAINSSLNSGGKINQAIADATDGLLDQATADGLYATKGDLEGLVTGDGIKETVNTAIKENLTQQDGELNTAINNAVSTAKDEISASLDGYATDEEVTGAIAAATGALETQIADKVSKGDMNTAITEATSGLLDKTDADGLYATKGELQSANTNITGLQESVNELDGRLDTAEKEIDNLQTSLGNKADASSVTDLSEKVSGLETSLGDKANASDVYSKEDADSTFLSKEDAANSYVSKDDLTNIKNDISTSLDNKFVSQNELDSTVQETITNQLGDTVSSAVSEEIKDQTAQLEQTVTENVKDSLDETFATDAELSAAKEELSGQITSATNGLSGKIDAITQEGGAIDTAVSEAQRVCRAILTVFPKKLTGCPDVLIQLKRTSAICRRI